VRERDLEEVLGHEGEVHLWFLALSLRRKGKCLQRTKAGRKPTSFSVPECALPSWLRLWLWVCFSLSGELLTSLSSLSSSSDDMANSGDELVARVFTDTQPSQVDAEETGKYARIIK
jgi:hypothetical protein